MIGGTHISAKSIDLRSTTALDLDATITPTTIYVQLPNPKVAQLFIQQLFEPRSVSGFRKNDWIYDYEQHLLTIKLTPQTTGLRIEAGGPIGTGIPGSGS